MSHVTPKEKAALTLFKERLHEAFPDRIDRITLFGSKARGEASKFSDVDVLVILKEGDWRDKWPMYRISASVILDTGIDLSLHIYTAESIKRMRNHKSPLLANIEKEGISI